MRNEHSRNRINFLASGTVFTAFLLLLCLMLTGCDFSEDFTGKKEKKEPKRQYSVVVQDSVLFVPTVSAATVSEGGTFTTELVYYRGFSFDSCNYENAVIENTTKGVKITLEDVDSDKRLIIRSKSVENSYEFPEKTGTITYYANGGRFGGGSDTLVQDYTISYHLKPNTDIGEKLTRQGYVLTGWNTKADGTGAHVGLGSRTDYYELYAEWAAYTNPALFTYRRTEGGITITGFKGAADVDPLVIPEYIDGMEVVEIDTSFTTNIPCGTIKSSTLILPKSIVTIKKGAFKNAEFTTLYFYDSLETVDEGAFGQRISYYHINAATAPHHQNGNDNARFADKVDYLSMQEGNRLVVFGGCSASYGIDSQLLGEEFSDYSVCNMGVIGGVNAIFQMQIIGHFLHEGDIFIHAPEEMSQHQLMRTLSVDYRVFILVEGNYDLPPE